MADVRAQVERALASTPVRRLARRLWDGRLRVLAYHDVPDPGRFEQHLQLLTAEYQPVSAGDVVAACRDGAALPRGAVWMTFDDGHPTVVEHALPLLERYGVRASLFVAPALVDTDEPFWWQAIDGALTAGVAPPDGAPSGSLVTWLKGLPDTRRRAIVASMSGLAADRGRPVRVQQLTSTALDAWLAAGHTVGNHSWDHPCLDRCEPAMQEEQVVRTDAWLRDRIPGWQPLFAYPNGNWTAVTDRVLHGLGYPLAALFDHRIADPLSRPLELSRLRIDADASPRRLAAIVSGAHSLALGARERISGRRRHR